MMVTEIASWPARSAQPLQLIAVSLATCMAAQSLLTIPRVAVESVMPAATNLLVLTNRPVRELLLGMRDVTLLTAGTSSVT